MTSRLEARRPAFGELVAMMVEADLAAVGHRR